MTCTKKFLGKYQKTPVQNCLLIQNTWYTSQAYPSPETDLETHLRRVLRIRSRVDRDNLVKRAQNAV
jgi:hypothetical protein